MSKRVYPVEGRFLQDRPHVEHDCDDPFCVESGAFTYSKPPKKAPPDDSAEAASPEPEES